jgi:hypothetical protein
MTGFGILSFLPMGSFNQRQKLEIEKPRNLTEGPKSSDVTKTKQNSFSNGTSIWRPIYRFLNVCWRKVFWKFILEIALTRPEGFILELHSNSSSKKCIFEVHFGVYSRIHS